MALNKLTIDIPDDLKFEFKLYCLQNKTTMKDVLLQLIQDYLKEKNGKE